MLARLYCGGDVPALSGHHGQGPPSLSLAGGGGGPCLVRGLKADALIAGGLACAYFSCALAAMAWLAVTAIIL